MTNQYDLNIIQLLRLFRLACTIGKEQTIAKTRMSTQGWQPAIRKDLTFDEEIKIMYCKHCGGQLENNPKFCKHCGGVIGEPTGSDTQNVQDQPSPLVNPIEQQPQPTEQQPHQNEQPPPVAPPPDYWQQAQPIEQQPTPNEPQLQPIEQQPEMYQPQPQPTEQQEQAGIYQPPQQAWQHPAQHEQNTMNNEFPPIMPETPPTEKKQRKKRSKKALIPIIVVGVVVIALIAVGAVYFITQSMRNAEYEEALDLMGRGNYAEALVMFENLGTHNTSEEQAVEVQLRIDYYAAVQLMNRSNYEQAKSAFEALGTFRDSAALANECQMIMDYNEAVNLMESGNFTEALTAFEALGDFRDSAELATECQQEIDYAIAVGYMEAGDYPTAAELFAELGTFRDSSTLAEECNNRIRYAEALALLDRNNYAEALIVLEPLVEIGFRDSAVLAQEAQNTITYAMAEEYYEEGLFYTAYNLFISLGNFRDSADRAEQCIQEHPSTGQLYRNQDFTGTAVELRIRTPSEDPRPTVVKIYTEDEVLVSTIFIRAGSSSTVRLPVNTYMIRIGYGDNWFGEYEYFGDANAFYLTLQLEGGQTYAFRRNFIYTLTIRDEVDDLFAMILNEGRDGF